MNIKSLLSLGILLFIFSYVSAQRRRTTTYTYNQLGSLGDSCASGYDYSKNQQSCRSNLICKQNKCACPSQYKWSSTSDRCLDCPDGWLVYKGKCIFVAKTPKSWFDAQNACDKTNSDLLSIETDVVIDFLITLYSNLRLTDNYHIGLESDSTCANWKWLATKKSLSAEGPWWHCQNPLASISELSPFVPLSYFLDEAISTLNYVETFAASSTATLTQLKTFVEFFKANQVAATSDAILARNENITRIIASATNTYNNILESLFYVSELNSNMVLLNPSSLLGNATIQDLTTLAAIADKYIVLKAKLSADAALLIALRPFLNYFKNNLQAVIQGLSLINDPPVQTANAILLSSFMAYSALPVIMNPQINGAFNGILVFVNNAQPLVNAKVSALRAIPQSSSSLGRAAECPFRCAMMDKNSILSTLCKSSLQKFICQKRLPYVSASTAEAPYTMSCRTTSECPKSQFCMNRKCQCGHQYSWSKSQNKCVKCEYGWLFQDDRCFYLSVDKKTQSDAGQECKRLKSDATLWYIDSAVISDSINSLYKELPSLSEPVWVAAKYNETREEFTWPNNVTIPDGPWWGSYPQQNPQCFTSNIDHIANRNDKCVQAYQNYIVNVDCNSQLRYVCQYELSKRTPGRIIGGYSRTTRRSRYSRPTRTTEEYNTNLPWYSD